jgi:8-oxo-dGTP pyrophosphatase MutT (NUDIX family)
VVYRKLGPASPLEVALISVGEARRWQLPKGTIERGETPAQAAQREVQEETGLEGDVVEPLATIDFWYQGTEAGQRVRYHKFVQFFLLRFRGGDVSLHDAEAHEARWFPIDAAITALAFPNERHVAERARARLLELVRARP